MLKGLKFVVKILKILAGNPQVQLFYKNYCYHPPKGLLIQLGCGATSRPLAL